MYGGETKCVQRRCGEEKMKEAACLVIGRVELL
jgi:hypothetical protein